MELDCATELRLGPPGSCCSSSSSRTGCDQTSKRPPPCAGEKRALEEASATTAGDDDRDQDATATTTAPAAKAQVVGWPPVRAYRKNTFQAAAKKAEQQGGGLYVKVSMDGAPYLRKVDLRMYKGYMELREALDVLFSTKSFPGAGTDQLAIAYEDKDGDLMLAGDVPWDMFISSCKKLRIMKGSEAR